MGRTRGEPFPTIGLIEGEETKDQTVLADGL